MATPPETPPTGQQSSAPQNSQPGVRQQYWPPEGAISMDRVKRVGMAVGFVVLGYFTIWGSCHRQTAAPEKKPTAKVWPMSPANIDSQEAELDREMEEAKRAAEQAEFAKRRAQSTLEGEGPHTGQADPVSQLRQQMHLEDLRRQHNAAYASTVAFAPQGGRAEAKADSASQSSSTAPGLKTEQPVTAQKPGENQNAESSNSEAPPGTYRLDEGTIIETVLLNRLDGEFSGPVITQVSSDVYSRAGIELLIPKGSRLLGEAREVSGFDQRRLAVLFHRLILPNANPFRSISSTASIRSVKRVSSARSITIIWKSSALHLRSAA